MWFIPIQRCQRQRLKLFIRNWRNLPEEQPEKTGLCSFGSRNEQGAQSAAVTGLTIRRPLMIDKHGTCLKIFIFFFLELESFAQKSRLV